MELPRSTVFLLLVATQLHLSLALGGMLGGFSKPQRLELMSEGDRSYVLSAADKAVELMNDVKTEGGRSNALPISLVEIGLFKKQVVAGMKYDMMLKVRIDGQERACNLIVTNLVNIRGGAWSVHAKTESDPCVQYAPLKSQPKTSSKVLGGDDHDYQPHGKPILGGDDHDYQPHGKPILGGDDHDYQPHGKPILGGDDHDYQPHGKPILGGDDHDYQPHGKPILGGDDHDYKPHGTSYKVPSLRDFLPKGKPFHQEPNFLPQTNLKKGVMQMHILGGDDHDYVPHGINCDEHKDAFESFKTEHNKLYGSKDEEDQRFKVFCANMEKVKDYQNQEQGSAVYGASKFADLSEEEFKKQYLGLRLESAVDGSKRWPDAKIPKGPVPHSWDWRDHGAVTPVKNQGECGSCWAFSTTGNIEGQWAIVNKKLYSLSEQELVDCDKLDDGCDGGLPSLAYESIMKLGGLETESDYKYDGYDEKCKFDKTEVVVNIQGAVNISSNETEMAAWLYHNGPISIGINAFAMQFYLWGVSHPWKIFCSPSELDHGVLIVGYGSENGEPYWIVKNSWGADWGRKGYYYVYRGDGTCGLNTMCTSAQVGKK